MQSLQTISYKTAVNAKIDLSSVGQDRLMLIHAQAHLESCEALYKWKKLGALGDSIVLFAADKIDSVNQILLGEEKMTLQNDLYDGAQFSQTKEKIAPHTLIHALNFVKTHEIYLVNDFFPPFREKIKIHLRMPEQRFMECAGRAREGFVKTNGAKVAEIELPRFGNKEITSIQARLDLLELEWYHYCSGNREENTSYAECTSFCLFLINELGNGRKPDELPSLEKRLIAVKNTRDPLKALDLLFPINKFST